MDVFTLYVGQGALAAVRAGDEAIVIDAHMNMPMIANGSQP